MRFYYFRSRKIDFLVAFTMALAVAVFWFSDASAHAYLVRSEPSDGLILSEGPADIRLWFDEPVSGKFSSAQLIDPNGQPVKISSIRVDPVEPKLLVVSLPELSPGAYSLLYKALSETDGHFSQGLLVFGIGEEVDLSSARAVETEQFELPLPEVGLRWFNFIVLAGIVGALAISQLVFGTSHTSVGDSPLVLSVLQSAKRRVVGLVAGLSILGLVVGIGMILWQIHLLMISLPEDANAISVSQKLLIGTRWGQLWVLRQLNLLLILPVLIRLFRRVPSPGSSPQPQAGVSVHSGVKKNTTAEIGRWEGILWLLAAMLALTLLTIQSLTSHTSGLAENTLIALLADALHLLAASLWVGGLLALAIALVPLLAQQRAELPSLIRAGWNPFSLVAVFSVATLFATGFYNAGRQIASVDALLTTFYGHALVAKVTVVILVGAIGLLNSMLLHPRLAAPLARIFHRPAGWTPLPLRRLPNLVIVEVSVGILVMLMTGVVTSSPAPRGIEYTLQSQEIPSSLSQTVDDLVITLSTKPNRPGQNVFNVFVRSTRRPPPSEIARVILRFDYLKEEIGRTSVAAEQVASDRFILGGNYFSVGGEWQVQVVVRRLGLEDSVATFNWIVVPPGEIRPTVVSREPIEPVMTFLAAVMILLIATAAAAGWVVGGRSREARGISQLFKSRDKTADTETMPTIRDMTARESGEVTKVAWQHEISAD